MKVMNILPKKCIENNLKIRFGENLNKYGDRLLGTFVVGIANYGFATDIQEIRYITIYFPSFSDMCTSRPAYITTDDETLIDIRICYNAFEKDPFGLLEVLFSDYYMINKIYKDIFKESFIDNREKIARGDEYGRISKAKIKAVQAYNDGDVFEAIRLYYAASAYAKGDSCYFCYHPHDPMIVSMLAYAKETNKAYVVDLEKNFDAILSKFDESKRDSSLLKEGVILLVAASLRDRVSIETFEEQLPAKEQRIFNMLREKGNGIYSISKLIEEFGVSRPVFTSLLNKMNDSNIAAIRAHGAKGTSIRWVE